MSDFNLDSYQAARVGAVYHRVPTPGFLRIAGDDRQIFLQRQTTNDVKKLEPGQAVITCLTSPLARILDVLYLIPEPQSIGVVTLPGRGAATAAYLRSRIFFMDKVTLEDLSEASFQLDLLGPLAGDVLQKLGLEQKPGIDHIVGLLDDHLEWSVWALNPSFSPGFRVLGSLEMLEGLQLKLEEAGAFPLGEQEFQAVRVEAGLPAAEKELTEDFTPFEVGLKSAVSDQKGCYTGQEVLARQVTYDKVTQRLVGLKLETPLEIGARLQTEDGKPAGVITSCVASPLMGVIGLGVVKRPYDEAGTHLLSANGSGGPGLVVDLPF